jgi:hypothetical protein
MQSWPCCRDRQLIPLSVPPIPPHPPYRSQEIVLSRRPALPALSSSAEPRGYCTHCYYLKLAPPGPGPPSS